MQLQKKIDNPRHRYLVFTSAGDNANLQHWLEGTKTFDLWVSYYGDTEGTFQQVADYYGVYKVSKFQALHEAYRNWPETFHAYSAVFVLDDDLIFSARSIAKLFQIREQRELLLLQPAFDASGKISHGVTRWRPFSELRYTNFVEVTCPLFRADVLCDFLELYDRRLVGWGIDWWYSSFVSDKGANSIAVIDEVTCINPHDHSKSGGREIDLLQSKKQRQAVWAEVKKERLLENVAEAPKELGRISNYTSPVILGRAVQYVLRKSFSLWQKKAR